MKKVNEEKMVRTQVSITNGELEILKEMMSEKQCNYISCVEEALTNGILNQIVRKTKEEE